MYIKFDILGTKFVRPGIQVAQQRFLGSDEPRDGYIYVNDKPPPDDVNSITGKHCKDKIFDSKRTEKEIM